MTLASSLECRVLFELLHILSFSDSKSIAFRRNDKATNFVKKIKLFRFIFFLSENLFGKINKFPPEEWNITLIYQVLPTKPDPTLVESISNSKLKIANMFKVIFAKFVFYVLWCKTEFNLSTEIYNMSPPGLARLDRFMVTAFETLNDIFNIK